MSETFEQFLEERQTPAVICSGVSDYHMDLWEHGCLLFSAFEWEAAADLFADLSHSIPVELYSTLCLLNASIIYARLGEFQRASQVLAEAENVAELLPITLFLMGHIEYELDNLEKSEDCFNIALGALDLCQRFNHLGLNYVLREELIQENLAALQSPSLGIVATIPGDVVFEAPPRDDVSIPANDRGTGQWSIKSASTSDALSSRSIPINPTSAILVPKVPLDDGESEKYHETASPRILGPEVALTSHSTASAKFKVFASPAPSKKDRTIARYIKLRAAGKKAIAQQRSTKKAPEPKLVNNVEVREPAKRIQRMEARDARPGGNTTADLSSFIRSLPKQNKLVARDPRGRPGSTGGLAEFFRGTGPDDPQAAMDMISRVSIDSILLSELESLGSVGLHDASRRATSTNKSRDSIQQGGSMRPPDKAPLSPRINSIQQLGSDLSVYPMPGRPDTVYSDSSWQSQDTSDVNPSKLPQKFQPQAIHPAMRPGFSLD